MCSTEYGVIKLETPTAPNLRIALALNSMRINTGVWQIQKNQKGNQESVSKTDTWWRAPRARGAHGAPI